MHKISASTKYWLFTIFRQNSAVSISAHRRLSKSGKSKKLSPSLFNVSFSIPDLHLEAVTKILCLSRELSQLGWGWRGGERTLPCASSTCPNDQGCGQSKCAVGGRACTHVITSCTDPERPYSNSFLLDLCIPFLCRIQWESITNLMGMHGKGRDKFTAAD
jgi:hypothetical protein